MMLSLQLATTEMLVIPTPLAEPQNMAEGVSQPKHCIIYLAPNGMMAIL